MNDFFVVNYYSMTESRLGECCMNGYMAQCLKFNLAHKNSIFKDNPVVRGTLTRLTASQWTLRRGIWCDKSPTMEMCS